MLERNTRTDDKPALQAASAPPDDDESDQPDTPDEGEEDPNALPENVPDDWLDPKPFDPAGR
jgi:hypothetical protein